MGFDVLIVGAGIVGAACACELAAAGLRVGVIEGETVAGGATAAGMGHIVVMDDGEAQLALTRYSQTLWDALIKESPAGHEYTRCGTIWVAADDEEMRAARDKHAVYSAHGIPGELLDARALYEVEPRLRQGLAGGLRVSGDSVVYPPRSASLLLEEAYRSGTTLLRQTVTHLMPGGVHMRDGTTIDCDTVVIATGSRARELDPELPIVPKKGHLAITDRYPDFVRHQLVELGYVKNAHATSGDSVAFNVQPRNTGQLLIGSSRQFDAPDARVDQQILATMLRRAIEYLPELRRLACIRFWTGFRAATPDGLPLIGRHPERAGVWLATGHEGLGITTSLGTARLLATQILGQTPAIPVEPYLPSRAFQGMAHV